MNKELQTLINKKEIGFAKFLDKVMLDKNKKNLLKPQQYDLQKDGFNDFYDNFLMYYRANEHYYLVDYYDLLKIDFINDMWNEEYIDREMWKEHDALEFSKQFDKYVNEKKQQLTEDDLVIFKMDVISLALDADYKNLVGTMVVEITKQDLINSYYDILLKEKQNLSNSGL